MPEPDPDAIDYYARIGVRPEADRETIERQRKQADRRFSPMGTSPDADEKRHMRINEASSVLEEPDQRRRYDSLYESLGPINGTLAFETLSTDVIEAVRDSERLSAHLRGFVEVLGPKAGARQFTHYHEQLAAPVPDVIDSGELPNGYSVADSGFGLAVWSWHRTDRPCSFSLWITGGQHLWRTAVLEPESVDQLVTDLQTSGPATLSGSAGNAPSGGSNDHGDIASSDDTPPTQISRGHPSSAVVRGEADESIPSMAVTASWALGVGSRLHDVVSYIVATGSLTAGYAGVLVAAGLVGSLLATVVFLPLLAVMLVVQSSLPELSVAGLPLVDPDSPVASLGFFHYLVVGVATTTAAWVTGRLLVPWIQRRKSASLPRDAWLVFGSTLLALVGALFLGVGQSELAQWPGLALTGLLAAFTFQASMDIGAPRPLALLCQSVATLSFALAGAVASLVGIALAAVNTSPVAFETYRTVVLTAPIVDPTLFSAANAELIVVGFAALAIIPLALTTLYSLAYTVESIAIRVRSRASG